MTRALASILLLSAAALATGCGGGIQHAAETPPRPVDPQTRATPASEIAPPHLIAPPPAYGNKIVMARGGAHTRVN